MQVTSKGALFVFIQLLLFLIYIIDLVEIPMSFPKFLSPIGVVLMVVGGLVLIIAILQLNINLSPFPKPVKGSKLISNGVYTYIRHPIYSGIIISFLGNGLYKASIVKIAVTALLLLLFYFKSKYEEGLLQKAHPDYKAYMKKTYRLFPWIL